MLWDSTGGSADKAGWLCMLKASVPSKPPRATKDSFSKWMATAANSGLLLMFAVQMSALESCSLRQICLAPHWTSLMAAASLGAGPDGCAGVSALQLRRRIGNETWQRALFVRRSTALLLMFRRMTKQKPLRRVPKSEVIDLLWFSPSRSVSCLAMEIRAACGESRRAIAPPPPAAF